MTPAYRKILVLLALLLALFLGLVLLDVRLPGFDWGAFAATLRRLSWAWLAGAAAFALSTYLGRAVRWAVLMRPVCSHPSLRNLLSATVIGFTAVTLLGRPGEFVRPYLVAAKERVSFSSQLGAWLLERIFDLLAVLLIFGYGLARVRQSEVRVGPALAWVLQAGGTFVALASLASLALLVALRNFSGPLRSRILRIISFLPEKRFKKASELLNAVLQGVESTRSHHALGLLLLYTILEWALIAACFFCVIRAFGAAAPFGLVDVLIFLGFVSFGAVVQIPGIGGGIQVVSVLVLTELFRLPLETATSIALVLWLITFIVIVPFGLALALREGVSWARLKTIGRQAAE
ncbi:MAG: flippase-like domain-containing protein [Acidobacteria bacterium]|nr:flippase-like domain-containing protein [Acidobacteriota bacterium]